MAPSLVAVSWNVPDASLGALTGTITFTPVAILAGASVATPVTITDSADQLVIGPAGVTRQLSVGTVELVPTDNGSLSPAGWMYQITTAVTGLPPTSMTCLIPHSPSPVDLSALMPAVAVEAVQPYATLAALQAAQGAITAAQPLSLLVPAYQYPTIGSLWAGLEAACPPVRYLVANIASGPGTGPANSDYTTAISAAVAAGITVLGYVDTAGGSVLQATVAANTALWNSLYGVTSFFLDNAATSTGEISYYATACAAIRAAFPGKVIVLNHGAIPDPGYAPLADVLMVFENAESAWPAFTPPSWFASWPAAKFGAIIYSASGTALMSTVMTQARGYGIGHLYVTDQGGGNPYTTLPAYWTAEIARAKFAGTI